MTTSTRTPEGEPNECPVCGHKVRLEPSRPPGDAPCPQCGTLLWFPPEPLAPVLTAWEYGIQMIKRGEVVAGVQVLQSVVTHKPSDVELRRLLREIETGIGGIQELMGESASLVLNDVWYDIRQMKHKRAKPFVEWDAIDRAVERGLAIDPRDVELHVELGQACQARGYNDAARFAYQCALEIAPERTDVREALEELAKS
jgi:hypothetical protein